MKAHANLLALSAASVVRGFPIARGWKTRDNMTVATRDGMVAINPRGDRLGLDLGGSFRTHDGRTVDSTGAFLVGELERLDQKLNMPLFSVTYGRDIEMREDVTLADEVASFTQSTWAASGGLGAGQGIRNGKNWISKMGNVAPSPSLDIAKIPQGLFPWGMEIKWSIFELESAAKLGRPVDDQQIEAVRSKHQMDIDEQVYVGDSTNVSTGLVNHASVTNVTNVPNGAGGNSRFVTKTPAEILADFNELLQSGWAASGWKVMPNRILLPPAQFGYLSTQIISTGAGNISILKFLLENNILKSSGQGELEILPVKWLIGAGTGGTLGTLGTVDRMVAYTKNREYVRYPMTLLQRTPLQYDNIYHKAMYYCKLGLVEMVYPETVAYRDGI